jgi:hypothetical protein
VTLDPADIEAIARRTVELLIEAKAVETSELVDAATVGKQLGLSAERVRRKGHELGGVKIGDGPHARWRFDLQATLQEHAKTNGSTPTIQAPRRRPRGSNVPLLPIRP